MVRVIFDSTQPVRSLPAIVPCPVCRSKTIGRATRGAERFAEMKVTFSPELGCAWTCYRCRRTWDSLELLAEVRHSGNIYLALEEVRTSPHFIVPQHLFNASEIETYVRDIEARRKRQTWFDSGKSRWVKHRDTYAMISADIGVKVHVMEANEAARSNVGRWICGTGIFDIAEAFNDGMKIEVPVKAFNECLAVPWSRIPGRTSALLLIARQHRTMLWCPSDNPGGDPGLMLSDAIPLQPDRVFALSSPYMALWLQYRQFFDSNTTLPVVAWHHYTNPAVWQQVAAREVVFWGYMPSPGLFKQALNTPGSKVCFADLDDLDVRYTNISIEEISSWKAFRDRLDPRATPNTILNNIYQRAVDPWKACLDYLLSLNEVHSSEVLDTLKLNAEQVSRIFGCCTTDKERNALRMAFDRQSRQAYVDIAGRRAFQYLGPNEARWSVSRGKLTETVTNAVPRVEWRVDDEITSEPTYVGRIFHAGQEYPFTASYEELNNDLVRFIIRTVERGGGPTPIVSASWSSRLRDLLWAFSGTVKPRRGVSRVGWNADRQMFYLPKFIIRNGQIEVTEGTVVGSRRVPCLTLRPRNASPEQINALLAPTEANGAFWAIFTAILDNVLSPVRHLRPRGIAVTGELGWSIVEALAEEWGLITFEASKLRQLDDFEYEQKHHDVPCVVLPTAPNGTLPSSVVSWMHGAAIRNAIFLLSPAQAASAASADGWVIVDTGKENRTDWNPTGSAALLVHCIADFQKQAGRVVESRNRARGMLKTVQAWIEQRLEHASPFVINCAHQITYDTTADTSAARFVDLLIFLLADSYLDAEVSGKPTSKSVSMAIDEAEQRIYVRCHAVTEAVTKNNLVPIDVRAITAALREDRALVDDSDISFWVIDMAYWKARITALARRGFQLR